MYNSKWNDCEREHYEKFAKTDEGLAYTIAMEMYHARIADERMKDERTQIANAMRSIADGIRTLERITGFSIHDQHVNGFMSANEASRILQDVGEPEDADAR